VTFNQVLHILIALIKYVVVLVLMVVGVKFWTAQSRCFVDSEDMGMRPAIGKTTMKVDYDVDRRTEAHLKRGDVAIVRMRVGEGWSNFPFRVVAVEGDRIEARSGVFKVNGKKERYPGGVKLVAARGTDVLAQLVPRGHVYMLPDNRRKSLSDLPELIPLWRVVGKVAGLSVEIED